VNAAGSVSARTQVWPDGADGGPGCFGYAATGRSRRDTYGHPVGDLVLRQVGRRLSDATRSGDVIARYGGEEFAVLLPGTEPEVMLALAERLRAVVADTSIRLEDGTDLPVTVSVGLAAASAGHETAGQLTLSADQGLYASKAAGRNRVTPAAR
jgi:two-component system cell cycle response regulator